MMKQIQKKKFPIDPETGAEIYPSIDVAFEEIQKEEIRIDAKYLELIKENDKTKKQIILEYAEELEQKAKVPRKEISTHMAKVLKGFATERWIQECLPDEYKDPIKQEESRGRRSSSPTVEDEEDEREREIWQFDVSWFDIKSISKAPRKYLEDALEFFYGEYTKRNEK
jgi:hypothetical protein